MPWEQMTSLPITNYGMQSAVVGGKLYVIGGWMDTNATYEYDPALNTWAAKADANLVSEDHQAAVRSDVIYLIYDGTGSTTDSNEIRTYTPATNTWSSITDSPVATTTGRYGWLVADASGNIYQGGGTSATAIHLWNGSSWSSTVTSLSPATAYEHMKSVLAHNSKIYIMGGVLTGTSTGTAQVLEYTPPTTWATKTSLPEARYSGSVVAKSPWVYYFGGSSGSLAVLDVLRYDPALDAWTDMGDLPHGFGFKTAAGVIDNYAYVVGGYVGGTHTAQMWRIEVGYDELAVTIESEATVETWPQLAPENVEAESEVTGLMEVVFVKTMGGVASSFIPVGSTGADPALSP